MEDERLTTHELIKKYVKKIAATSLSLNKYIETGNKLLDAAVSGEVDTIECSVDVHYGHMGRTIRIRLDQICVCTFLGEDVLRTCIETVRTK